MKSKHFWSQDSPKALLLSIPVLVVIQFHFCCCDKYQKAALGDTALVYYYKSQSIIEGS